MIISVNSFEEAKNYPVMFNSSELMMNTTQDIFYVKSVDGIGKYTMSTYKFYQVENEKPLTAENFATKEQLEGLSSKLDLLIQELGVAKDG